jgi:acetyltransferase-like isoleucine patch superfamily enzyme
MLKVTGNISDNRIEGTNDPSCQLTVHWIGNSNVLRLGPNSQISGNITFWRSSQVVEFEGDNRFTLALAMKGAAASLSIGSGTRSNGLVQMNIGEWRDSIRIGKNCLFSRVRLRTSDSHGIFDRTSGARINPSKPIVIGDEVWLAEEALVLKGANIGSGSVIGARSTVVGELPEHSLCVGTPARAIRGDIRWTHSTVNEAHEKWVQWRRRRRPKA